MVTLLFLAACGFREGAPVVDTADRDTAAEDTAADTGTDTATDTATCEGTTCVVYACYCGECTDADIQCVTQAWADANPCALGCPVAECPALATTECECDDASGDCRKK